MNPEAIFKRAALWSLLLLFSSLSQLLLRGTVTWQRVAAAAVCTKKGSAWQPHSHLLLKAASELRSGEQHIQDQTAPRAAGHLPGDLQGHLPLQKSPG